MGCTPSSAAKGKVGVGPKGYGSTTSQQFAASRAGSRHNLPAPGASAIGSPTHPTLPGQTGRLSGSGMPRPLSPELQQGPSPSRGGVLLPAGAGAGAGAGSGAGARLAPLQPAAAAPGSVNGGGYSAPYRGIVSTQGGARVYAGESKHGSGGAGSHLGSLSDSPASTAFAPAPKSHRGKPGVGGGSGGGHDPAPGHRAAASEGARLAGSPFRSEMSPRPDLASPLSTKSAYLFRDTKAAAMQTSATPGPGGGGMRRIPSHGAMLKHTESRVALALSSKKLALQRQRRLNIKGESFRDVLAQIKERPGDEEFGDRYDHVLSPSVAKSEATRSILMDSLRSNFLMSCVSQSELEKVVGAMFRVKTPAGTDVVTQGEPGDQLYVIETGDLDVIVDGKVVSGLGPGHNFGELALMYNSTRAATVRAMSDSVMWCLDRRIFRKIILKATNQTLMDNRRWLRKVPLLSRLPQSKINRLADALQPVSFKAGVTVIKQGDDGNIFYLVKSGRVVVSQDVTPEGPAVSADKPDDLGLDDVAAPKEQVQIMELGDGEHFGERALMTAGPRAATVTAATDVVLMALDRESFQELLGPLEDVMEVTHSQRRLAAARVHLHREESLRTMREVAESKEKPSKGEESKKDPKTMTPAEKKKEARRRRKESGRISPLKRNGMAPVLRQDCTLDRLKTVAVLGEGAFGLVKLVEHRDTGELFALKQMQKARVVKTGQERNVCNEKKLLAKSDHPYILKLMAAFKDADCLYIVLEFLQGGDMFGHLYKQGGKFDSNTSIFYAATVLTVFDYLHSQHIVYRDLKPENLVLDRRGYLKVVDFGFAKEVRDRTFTLCGTPEYLAPELVQGKGHDKAVDYWALGILIYEMLQGYSPFADEEHNKQITVYKNIIKGKVVFSSKLRDNTAINLIMSLLAANPSQRLGCGRKGIREIMNHRWFRSVQWKALLEKKVLPPIIPQITGRYDLGNFDEVAVEHNVIVKYKDDGTGWDDDF